MFFLYSFLGCLFLSLNDVIAFERQLGVLNFTCTNSSGTRLDKLTVVEAKGEKDLLYYLWDFSAKPTFLIVQVPLRTEIKLNCSGFINDKPDSLSFTNKPSFVFGVIVNKLYEFNDENDTATFNSSDTTIRTYDGKDFRWNVSISQIMQPSPLDAFRAVGKPFNSTSSGTLEIAVGAYTSDGTSVDPPHLMHTANGSQVDIALNNFPTFFNQSRFAVQFVVLSSLEALKCTSTVKNTTDDENTPGVFKLNTINFDRPKRFRNNNRGYMMWLPLVYTFEGKTVTLSTGAKQYNITDVKDKTKLFDETLLMAMYGDEAVSFFAKELIISFGSRTDKFYQKTKYSSWSFVFGIGESPNPDANSFFYLIFFSACVVSSILLAVLINYRWIKVPGFLSARSASSEILVNE